MDFSAFIILVALVFPAHAPDRVFVFPPASSACVLPAFPPALVRIQTSGIKGAVYLLAGNRMPSPPRGSGGTPGHPADTPGHPTDTPGHPAKGPGVKATICIFALTNDSQVTRKGTSPYCTAVHTRLIRQVDTDDKGNFEIPLPPGTYSVFTKKGNLFYATRRDEQNNIAPVKVLPGGMTRVECSVESDQKVLY